MLPNNWASWRRLLSVGVVITPNGKDRIGIVKAATCSYQALFDTQTARTRSSKDRREYTSRSLARCTGHCDTLLLRLLPARGELHGAMAKRKSDPIITGLSAEN